MGGVGQDGWTVVGCYLLFWLACLRLISGQTRIRDKGGDYPVFGISAMV